ncbi:DHA2 family efflux MFS transporter permease subunit [Georgenia subflava]|uniref:DHA2 family efflux MFS transporter permease subunit n=1 Tax=Georgenia subflava TaxID=1622177 RepID=A0A6N7EMI7_9MICO|nr:DHA2 family efflux MFS transporter permease subunit [Georgenia subflava]MPV37356.1 DHA2 family efflux MFS transporter permease subunit [Georgenia subflava]
MTESTTAPADTRPAPPERLQPETRLVISLLLVSSFVVILNETIMGVALPRVMESLAIGASAGQWLTTAFMLTMAVVIPVTGFLLQRYNTRPIFMAAMSLFSTGTLLCAIAPGFSFLVLGRVVQASGTAIMMPLLMTTIMTLVPAHLRGRTMGNIGIVMSVAPAIGPTVSGLILSVLDWRWMFWLVLPIALLSLGLGAVRVRNVSSPRKHAIDVPSVLVSAVAFGGLIYGLSAFGAAVQGGTAVNPWIPLAVGTGALVVFVLRQRSLQRTDNALLDLRTFSARMFTVGVSLMFLFMLALFGTIILLPIYTQDVLGLTPLGTGLLLLPGGLLMGLLGPVVGRVYDRRGPRVLVIPGAFAVSGALWSLTQLDQGTPSLMVLGSHLVLSLGLGLMFTPLFTTSLGAVRPELYSHASALVGTVQQLAGAAGTSLFVVVMVTRAASLTSGGASEVAATAGGIRAAFLCGAVLSLFAVVAAFFVRRPAEVDDGAPAEVDDKAVEDDGIRVA